MIRTSVENPEGHEASFGLYEEGIISSAVVHGLRPSANVIDLRNEGREHSRTWGQGAQPLAAGGMLLASHLI